MKAVSIAVALTLVMCRAFGQTQPGFAVDFVVPVSASNVDGNTYSFAGPAIYQPYTIRYQQVYAASEFSYLTNFGGGWLTALLFRGDATNGTGPGIHIPNVQVNVSTTTRGPDGLSPTFSENVGPNSSTAVYSGQLNTSLDGGHRQGPEVFSFEIFPLVKLFFYDPDAGNLLLDVAVFQGSTTNPIGGNLPIVFDAVNITNDSVSRVWGDVNATTGRVDTVGLPTDLFFWPNPKLHVQLQTNSVGFWWPSNPTSFVFQTSRNLYPQALWQAITNGIVKTNAGFNAVSTFTIPLDSAGTPAYFRLVSTNPP